MESSKIKVLFTDLGGVLMSNGWDRTSREKAVDAFGLEEKEFESRHQLLFCDYETGKISLETYLHYTVFYKPRTFSYGTFVEFMHSQSRIFPQMIDLVRKLKKEFGLKVVVISNEGRELTDYRIKTFKLDEFVDFFIVSCFMGIRKPDRCIWEMALNLVHANPEETLYLEDRELFVEISKDLGIHSIWHKNIEETELALRNRLIQS